MGWGAKGRAQSNVPGQYGASYGRHTARERYLQSGVVDAVVKEASFPVAVIEQTYHRTGRHGRVQSPRTDLNAPQNKINDEKKRAKIRN